MAGRPSIAATCCAFWSTPPPLPLFFSASETARNSACAPCFSLAFLSIQCLAGCSDCSGATAANDDRRTPNDPQGSFSPRPLRVRSRQAPQVVRTPNAHGHTAAGADASKTIRVHGAEDPAVRWELFGRACTIVHMPLFAHGTGGHRGAGAVRPCPGSWRDERPRRAPAQRIGRACGGVGGVCALWRRPGWFGARRWRLALGVVEFAGARRDVLRGDQLRMWGLGCQRPECGRCLDLDTHR